jgi:hypothetical protein
MFVTPTFLQSKTARKDNKRTRKKIREELESKNYRRPMKTLMDRIQRMVSFFGVNISLRSTCALAYSGLLLFFNHKQVHTTARLDIR